MLAIAAVNSYEQNIPLSFFVTQESDYYFIKYAHI